MEYNLTGNEVLNMNRVGTYGDNTGSSGPLTLGQINTYDAYNHYCNHWWPQYQVVTEQSKVDKAFKVIEALMEQKMISANITVKQFMKLVNDIAKVI
jgi:hypothetical protein